MLDVSLRTGLLELMEILREKHQVGYLFITHDIALARHFCDRLLVMHHGKIVGQDETDRLINRSTHPYIKALIEAVEEPELLRPPRWESGKSRGRDSLQPLRNL
jgi:peptide/nickel transport system ATP-binding protein